MLKKITLFTFMILISLPIVTFADNYGKITGTITDMETREALVGVNVMIEGTSLGAATDLNGNFIILQVPPGTYDLRIDALGYKRVLVKDVVVRVNRIAYSDVTMSQTALDMEEILVIAERPVVEKDITATLRSVTSDDIDKLPTTTITDVIRTQPGVVNSGGLHFRGGRSGEVTYFVDGVPLINPLTSDFSYRPSEVITRDAISEMQVISGTYSAEYGNSMSGIINITTKEGGNEISANFNVKSSAAGFEQASVDNNRNVVRGTLSGPVFSPKTNFFISANYDDRDNYLPWGYRTENNYFVKLTDRHFTDIKLTGSFNYSKGKRKNYSHSWKYIEDQYWYEPNTESYTAALGFTHTLTSRLYYNMTLYYNYYHYNSGDYDYDVLTPEYKRDEKKEFYTFAYVASYQEDAQRTIGLKGDVLWQANTHNELKVGFEVRVNDVSRFYISSPFYDDHILDDYNKQPKEVAAYIQDKINFSSIILSAGLRFDLTDPNSNYWPSPYDAFNNNQSAFSSADIHTQLSPRLGISYPVTDKTVFHFGYGHYFQRPSYEFIYKAITDKNYDQNIVMNLKTGNGRFGNPNLKPEKSIEYEFGLSHQLVSDFLFNISVYSKKYINLLGTRTFFAGTKADIWETYTIHINEDFAYNNGLEIQLKKLRGTNLFGEINYTYAVAEGSSSGPLKRVGVEDANRQTLKYFPLDFDQRHSLNAYVTLRFNNDQGPNISGVHLLENFRTSLLFQYGSGLPYTKGVRGATEPYEENNMRLPENWTLDLKIDRPFRVGSFSATPYLEIFNLTDRKNVVYVDPFTGKPDASIGRSYEYAANPENWGPPRIIYLGIIINY
ncbi:TonB-dependent receptor [candidate division KSB1 bacterium]|nr:TonB-dependent receptor [candidate division KSB1 bacterium]